MQLWMTSNKGDYKCTKSLLILISRLEEGRWSKSAPNWRIVGKNRIGWSLTIQDHNIEEIPRWVYKGHVSMNISNSQVQ